MPSLNIPPPSPGFPVAAADSILRTNEDVQQCRAEIDRADQMILDALEYRARCVAHMARLKNQLGVPVCDPRREQLVLDRAASGYHSLPPERRRSIFAAIIVQMREWQSQL